MQKKHDASKNTNEQFNKYEEIAWNQHNEHKSNENDNMSLNRSRFVDVS